MILLVGLTQSIPMAGWQWLVVIPCAFGWYRLNLFLTDHRVSKEKPWFDGGLYWNETSFKHYTAGWVIGLLALGTMVGIGWLFGFYDIESVGYLSQNNASHHTTQLFQSSTSWYYSIFLFLLQMLAVGFYEEILLRGYILINLKEGIWWEGMSEVTALFVAVIISSLMFSFAHLFNPNASMITFITISLAGFLLAFPFLWTANLALSIGLHSAWNFILGGIFGFKVSGLSPTASFVSIQSIGPDWWTGGLFGQKRVYRGFLRCVCLYCLLLFFYRNPWGKSVFTAIG